jgi:hypothetical protein
MSPDSKILKSVVVAVLIFHTLWIANHLRWVATDQINPWKLGGYGMYTVPDPRVSLNLLDIRFPGAHFIIDPSTYSLSRFRRTTKLTNINRVFRCAHLKRQQLKALFEENPQLRGNHLRLLYLENKFIQNPVSVKRVRQGRVTIIWTGQDFFEYTSEFCGSQETGKVTFS